MSRRHRSAVSWRWRTARHPERCVRACLIRTGAPALVSYASWMRIVRCVACAKKDFDLDPPAPPREAPDFKMRQAGDAS